MLFLYFLNLSNQFIISNTIHWHFYGFLNKISHHLLATLFYVFCKHWQFNFLSNLYSFLSLSLSLRNIFIFIFILLPWKIFIDISLIYPMLALSLFYLRVFLKLNPIQLQYLSSKSFQIHKSFSMLDICIRVSIAVIKYHDQN